MVLDHDACYRAIEARDPRFDGRIFVAVKTTRIYCRPVCPARTPLSKNIIFYDNAAVAQENGFRPCLRCRPETAPDRGAWRGTSNTVSRGLALIERGALVDDDIDGIAERLGVGGRHLRRLFKQHLGATPISVEQTRRVLLAKKLLHETSLPMAEIAFAAGFKSIRRFNEVFQRMYHRPPSALRRAAVHAQPSEFQSDVTINLRFRPPYDWSDMLSQLQARAIEGVERVDGQSYMRSICINGLLGAIRVTRSKPDTLAVRIRFPNLALLPDIIVRIKRLFDLTADPERIAAQLGEDPLLAPTVSRNPGLRIAGAWDILETALGHAAGLGPAKALDERFGAPFETLGFWIDEQGADEMTMLRADFEQQVEQLSSFIVSRAVLGSAAAADIATATLQPYDALGADRDVLLAAYNKFAAVPCTLDGLESRFEKWRPWRAYACRYLLVEFTASRHPVLQGEAA